MVKYLNMTLLQIYYRVRQRKKFENRLIFGEVIGKSLVSCFFIDSRCTCRDGACVCAVDVSVEDSGNYTCEVFGRRSVVLATITHTVIVSGTQQLHRAVQVEPGIHDCA